MKKSSPYISLPYDFEIPLTSTTFYSFDKKVLKDFDLKKFVKNSLFHLQWKDFQKEAAKEKTTAGKILSLFKNEKLTESTSNIVKNKEKFLEQLNYFIEKKKPIVFTITQIAFKIPNSLKITRTTPDAGELALLSQFHDIIELIKKIHPPGARIIILGESYIFYDVVGISRKEAETYFKITKNWLKNLGWKEIVLEDLIALEKKVPKFKNEMRKNLSELKAGWKNKSEDVENEIKTVAATLFLCMNTRRYPKELLIEVFNRNIQKKTSSAKKLEEKIYNEALKQCFPYTAHHKSITTSSLGETLFPHSLPLSCTFSPGKLGIYPIGREAKLYSYHGVPVIDKKGAVRIRYEVDLLREKGVVGYYIKGETTPFFFRQT